MTPQRTRIWLIVAGIPIAGALIATICLLMWLPELPAEIVTQWGEGGEPGGTTNVTRFFLLPGIALVIGVLSAFWAPRARKKQGAARLRVAFGLAVGIAVFLCAATIAIVGPQVGIGEKPAPVPNLWIPGIIAIVAALGTGFLLYSLGDDAPQEDEPARGRRS